MEPRLDRRQYRSAAELIAEVRRGHLLSQRELAQRCGIAQAQLSRYESGAAEPTLATLRRLLVPFGWAPTIGVEPTTAVVDELLAGERCPLSLLDHEAMRAVQLAATAAANGVGIAVGGEAAAVLQGVPVRTGDVVLHVRRNDLPRLDQIAYDAHTAVLDTEDEDVWTLWSGGTIAEIRLTDVLPATRSVPLDFESWLGDHPAPVVDLTALRESGALGPTATALVARMADSGVC